MTAAVLERINRALDREDWETARRLLLDELKTAPDDHWLLTNIATTFYEQRCYEEALVWSERAQKEAPTAPWCFGITLALWIC